VTLPQPPGGRRAFLPRAAGDKPQELALSVNPRDRRNVVVSYHQAVGEGSDHHPAVRDDVHVAWTDDGGETWAVAERTTHPDYRVSIDADVTFGLGDRVFLVYIGMDTMSLSTRHGEYVQRSLDGGRTWEPPLALIERSGEGEPLLEHFPNVTADTWASSPHAGNVYVLWDRILGSGGSELIFVRSRDGGDSWSGARVLGVHEGRFEHHETVGPDGTLYVLLGEQRGDAHELRLLVSRDGGGTFDEPRLVVRAEARIFGAANFPRAGGIPLVGAGPDGRLFVVWCDDRNGDFDVFALSSGDGGASWTEPVRVNDDRPGNGRDQLMHWLAVDPVDGAVYVLFYDRRGDPANIRAGVTLARSEDDGRTFANHAWDPGDFDPTRACLGEYLGLGAAGGRVYAAWVENLDEGPPPRPPGSVVSGDLTLDERDWPFGPTAIRVGIADFEKDVEKEVGG
jgi:hypothetical protein